MSWQRPSPRVVWRAIDNYLVVAYAAAGTTPAPPGTVALVAVPEAVPSAVRARLETLRSTPNDAFYDSPVFEKPDAPKAGAAKPAAATGDPPPAARGADAVPAKYALRLGNRSYPHMKLIIERAPDGVGYLLRADTHDTHIQPRPGSREHAAFADLMRENRAVAEAVEAAWEVMGLPTFKKFLRDDLERRRK